MKIGIITIHRIINFGSALQAYALQRFLQCNTECEVEIIDYVFPNEYHKRHVSFFSKCRGLLAELRNRLFFNTGLTKKRFLKFRQRYLILSKRYNSYQELQDNPPLYDVYITGSDQVWNAKTLKNDPAFYCVFAPKSKRIVSFSASMSHSGIPTENQQSVRERLSRYSAIGIREQSSLSAIKKLGLDDKIPVVVNCDPTLLLSACDYNKIASPTMRTLPQKYILVYYLHYAYNPHPAIDYAVETISEKLHLPVVVVGEKKNRFNVKNTIIQDFGPSEFLTLVKNATYVITSSFHGLMFSLVYRKPFTAITPSLSANDTRISDFLNVVGLQNRSLPADTEHTEIQLGNPYTEEIEKKIEDYIELSKDFLLKSIKDTEHLC